MKNKFITAVICSAVALIGLNQSVAIAQRNINQEVEKYRPAFHFTPKAHWMNDPNGMVYYNGTYHLFFQYHPGGTTWGPMHWGHAVSNDLFNWLEKPIALYPDSLGAIFSGSAVIDKDNTAGFGKNAMVAIFTHHNQKIENAKTGLHQYQSIAYSNDEGNTWTKYKGNPVLPNPGITDFRDPKVMWFEQGKKWIMTLATKDRITFYSSPNLKQWTKESDFGATQGAHGGVWECPDLFTLTVNGKKVWVLLVSINPGGPNGGSATQYFTGSFNGHEFVADSKEEKWIDYGTDNYAGVTWSNTGDRRIFLGWMNNWLYANQVPTVAWRGATTVPRELSLSEQDGRLIISSLPVKELSAFLGKPLMLSLGKGSTQNRKTAKIPSGKPFELTLETKDLSSFSISLLSSGSDKVIFGYEKVHNRFFIDRRNAGDASFNKEFSAVHYGSRISESSTISMKVLIDAASIEVFADNGTCVMTDIFFPKKPINSLEVSTNKGSGLKTLKYLPLKRIN